MRGTQKLLFVLTFTAVVFILVFIMKHRSKLSPTPNVNFTQKSAYEKQTKSPIAVEAFNKTGTSADKPNIDIFLALITAPIRLDRRMANRETWLTTLPKYPGIAMRFFTDGKGWSDEERTQIIEESNKYGDIEFIPTKNGWWYGHRYLWMLFWAEEHYNFKFFLKTDDDYFVCLNNLNNDLQYRTSEKLLYWGWLGCDPSMVAMDSGLLIISHDLAHEFIKRNDSILCHPMAGQMIAMFINKLESEKYDVTYFADNSRLVHYRSHLKGKIDENLCSNLIGIHQAYPQHMREYWNHTKDTWFKTSFAKVTRKPYSEYCSRPKGWDWRVLGSFWKHEPKPCWNPYPEWPELDKYKYHKGRENEK